MFPATILNTSLVLSLGTLFTEISQILAKFIFFRHWQICCVFFAHFQLCWISRLNSSQRGPGGATQTASITYWKIQNWAGNTENEFIGQKLVEDFAKFCGLLRIYELYLATGRYINGHRIVFFWGEGRQKRDIVP